MLSGLLPDIAPTNSSNSNNRIEGITILCTVIPTSASTGLVFNEQEAT